jgi:prepilin-type N-terminal cleavage/methylation domain-containing protein
MREKTEKRMKTKNGQRGMTLIELMVALTVLTVGLAALVGLLATAISTNTRNKLDTGGTLVAQALLETIAAQPAGTDVAMNDCAGNAVGAGSPIVVKTAGSGAGSGANLTSDGSIDFKGQTAANVTSGYQSYYVGCGPAGAQVTYDVRWNVRTISSGSGYSETLVTVGAAETAVVASLSSGNQAQYAPPITLRTISATGN